MNNPFSDVINIFFGILSFFAIVSGFLVEEYRVLFWSVGSALLIVVLLGYYIFDSRNKINFLINRFNKIEESLNIYNRLNKLELEVFKK
ncbi:MAG: hypothetical protein KJ879_03405 [Nanoarchaeota archaeon]|nr:hypothetical protein [Nanoarchaeota archaeon]